MIVPEDQAGNPIIKMVEAFVQGPVASFFFSIATLTTLILIRDPLTPDMFHFTTCLHEEEAHFIWVMLLWLTYKCFLSLDTAQEALMSSESRI